jgi:signal recognition particle subunit SRP54
MFDALTEKIEGIFRQLRGHGKLSEANIEEAMREVRRALLEADVNYRVVKAFIDRVKARAVGQEVVRSLTPGQQVIRIVHEELIRLLGDRHHALAFSNIPPTVLMLVGLNGAGKTTAAAKLGRFLKGKGRRVALVAADVYRPAAVDQLEVLGRSIGVPVFRGADGADPVSICSEALAAARNGSADTLILDTAGRLHVDEGMMAEVERIRERTSPHEILFVADGMTGQDAVNAASEFKRRLDFTGVILTKMDGDARGGAALSIREVTGVPIKFVGVGEKVDALEPFHPDRMASRILGMGDILSLVERAEQAVSAEQAAALERKLRKESFTFEDFLEQLQQVKKMGPLDQLLDMIPGAGRALKGLQVDDRSFVHVEAIIKSMTAEERRKPQVIDGSRRRRIALGSGRSVQEVNRLLKQFQQMQKMVKTLGRMKPGRGAAMASLFR